MAVLVAIGYADESTAPGAQHEAERLAYELGLRPDAIASVVRHRDGRFRVHTSAQPASGGTTYGMFWGLLFGLIFFVPLLGLTVGAGLGALLERIEQAGVGREFRHRAQDLLGPGRSAVFLVVADDADDRAVEALSRYGGTVLTTPLLNEADLLAELGGAPATVPVPSSG